jgi:hypothetical protein
MADIAKLNGIEWASIAKVNGIEIASIASINGSTAPAGGGGGSFYNDVIDHSAMFDRASGSRLIRQLSNASDSLRIGTYSTWFKRSTLGTRQLIWAFGDTTATGNLLSCEFQADDTFRCVFDGPGAARFESAEVFRDCSGWYHIVLAINSTQGAQADRCKVYINGLQLTGATNDMPLNRDFEWTTGDYQVVTNWLATSTLAFDGYLAETIWVDGTQYAASDFGEFNEGVWIPKAFAGTYGSKGFHLNYETAANLGDDVSGNNRDLTVDNMGTDHQVLDRPEDNYCTLDFNAMYLAMISLNEGGLNPHAAASWACSSGTFQLKTGKWYFEVDIGGDKANIIQGILSSESQSGLSIAGNKYPGDVAGGGFSMYCNGTAYHTFENGNISGADLNLPAAANFDIMMLAVDVDAGKIWFGVNGTWGEWAGTGVGDPANGVNPVYTNLNADLETYVPALSVNGHTMSMANFGQRTFAHTPPTGFSALCSSNLSEPSIIEPAAEGINVVLWEGTGVEQAVTGVGFQPDFVWLRNRTETVDFHIYDAVRGATARIESSSTIAESANGETLKSFDADGFTVGTNDEVNKNTKTFVAWCLKDDPAYGFDIVSFQGTGAAHTENHDLGVKPELMMLKNRTDIDSWTVYHWAALNKTDPETDYGVLNSDGQFNDNNTLWNDTAPTSTVFTVGTHNRVNGSTNQIIAYLFASIEGFSKVFTYQGNGNINGSYAYCGFRPRWIFIKNVNAVSGWICFDTARNVYNPVDNHFLLQTDDAEVVGGTADIDCNSNGFKVRSTHGHVNNNNQTYVGIAFAEQPFKYSNAR